MSPVLTKPSPTSRRRQRERQARLELIRSAAIQVFARQGFANATMEQVATQAELGKATLYYYFKTKQELFADIVESAATTLRERMSEQMSGSPSPMHLAQELCHFWVQYFQQQPELAALLLPFIARGGSNLEAELGQRVASIVAEAHRPMLEALRSTDLGGDDPGALAALMSTLMLGLAAKAQHSPASALQQEIALFFDLIHRASEAQHREHAHG